MDNLDSESDAGKRAARLFSSAEAREMLEEFRSLVRAGVLRVTADNDLVFVKEPARPKATDDDLRRLDEQLYDWSQRKKQRADVELPADPSMEALREQVVEKLSQRILEQWESAGDHTLQEEVVDRITTRILKRWSGR